MANPEHLRIFLQGVDSWNKWRESNPSIQPDLSQAILRSVISNGINLSATDLTDAHLGGSYFDKADFSNAELNGANMSGTHLSGAKFNEAYLTSANLSGADLSNANLIQTGLAFANLSGANLYNTDFSWAYLNGTNFGNNDLSVARELGSAIHLGSSIIGIDTLYLSGGKIPGIFLSGCGVPAEFITQIPSLIESLQPIQFYSSFISYSHKDEEFAKRLFSRLRDANLRVWYAPEEMKGGQKLHEQIFSAIQIHDKLLLVLSENSLRSEWVATEIRRARKTEREENRRKLFPIRLIDFEAIQKWECFDADSGKDLAIELREYFISDFSNWKDHNSFEKAFDRLLRDLKAEDTKP